MSIALVLLDLQKGILQSGRIAWEDGGLPTRVLSAAGALLGAARGARMPVVHVRVVRPKARGAFDMPRTAAAIVSGSVPRDRLPLEAGTADIEFAVPVQADEEVVCKLGVSAFQGTRLDVLLRHLGADHILVAGVFTHMAVESTVRQGFDLSYWMTVVDEACCSATRALHESALSVGIAQFATIVSLAQASTLIAGQATNHEP